MGDNAGEPDEDLQLKKYFLLVLYHYSTNNYTTLATTASSLIFFWRAKLTMWGAVIKALCYRVWKKIQDSSMHQKQLLTVLMPCTFKGLTAGDLYTDAIFIICVWEKVGNYVVK